MLTYNCPILMALILFELLKKSTEPHNLDTTS